MAWIGVDLDGTLAHYDKEKGTREIGEPELTTQVRSYDDTFSAHDAVIGHFGVSKKTQ